MPKIYRLENEKSGTGVYQTRKYIPAYDAEDWKPYEDGRHPLPSNDDKLYPKLLALGTGTSSSSLSRFHYGYSSKKQYQKWWSKKARQILSQDDDRQDRLVLAVYEVPRKHMLAGDTQALFLKSEAKRVAVLAPNAFD